MYLCCFASANSTFQAVPIIETLGFQSCGCMVSASNGAVCALLALQKEKGNKNAGVPSLCQNLDW